MASVVIGLPESHDEVRYFMSRTHPDPNGPRPKSHTKRSTTNVDGWKAGDGDEFGEVPDSAVDFEQRPDGEPSNEFDTNGDEGI
jgi:hypothetical protein